MPLLDHIMQDINSAKQGSSDPTGQANDRATTIADGRDAVQGTLDTGPVVLPEHADAADDVVDVLPRYLGDWEVLHMLQEACLREPSQVKHHFKEYLAVWVCLKQAMHVWRHHPEQQIQIIRYAHVFPGQRLSLPILGRRVVQHDCARRISSLKVYDMARFRVLMHGNPESSDMGFSYGLYCSPLAGK